MASVAIDLFLPSVMLEAHGASEPAALMAIRNACFDFCKKSGVLTALLDPEPYVAGESVYQLSAPTDSVVTDVIRVVLNGDRALPASLPDVALLRYKDLDAGGEPECYIQFTPSELKFVPTPNTDGHFQALVSVSPSRNATWVDALLYDEYREVIRCGALYKLKEMVGSAWHDPAGAVFYEQRFLQGAATAYAAKNRGFANTSLRVAQPRFV